MIQPGHTTVNFVDSKRFATIVKARTESSVEQDAIDNEVRSPFTADDIKIKRGTSTEDSEHSYTRGAFTCSTGVLIMNGAKLHSHMLFHMMPHHRKPPPVPQQKLWRAFLKPFYNRTYEKNDAVHFVGKADFKNGFSKKLDEFFGHLDELLRTDQIKKGEEIYLDFVLSGGHYNNESSVQSRETIEELVEARMKKTMELANDKEVTINFAKSTAWGQIHLSNGGTSSTSIHYSPSENITSIHYANASYNPFDYYPPEATSDCYRDFEMAAEHLAI